MTQTDEDRWLNAAISALPEVPVPADLRRRIAELPIVHPRKARLPWWSPVGASLWWSLCGAMGILCGIYLDVPGQAGSSTAESLSLDQEVETWDLGVATDNDDNAVSSDVLAQEELFSAAFASQLSTDWSDTWDDAALSDGEGAP